jgi:hypothetical protein
LTGDEVGQVIEDWEEEWKTLVPETEQPKTQLPENDPKEEEEDQEGQGNGAGDTQKTISRPGEKRKEHDKGKSIHQRKKRKAFKEVPPKALTKDDREKIGDQVKEVMDEAFQHVAQKQEEIHTCVQEQIASLH